MSNIFKELINHLPLQDRSGYICSKELGSLLRTLGYNPTQDEVNNLMALVDVDHNGKVKFFQLKLLSKIQTYCYVPIVKLFLKTAK